MSIDGSGIIDSDLAHDVYNRILDLYDSGLEMEDIKAQIEAYKSDLDAMDMEICLAAEVKAFWEIGHLDQELIERLTRTLESGRSLAIWRSLADEDLLRERKIALFRLLKVVAKPRKVPRKRKKNLKVKSKLFKAGDCISICDDKTSHKGVVCKIIEHRGQCKYAILVMDINIELTIDSFVAGRYYGRRLPLSIHGGGSVLAPHVILPDHRMLVRSSNPFAILGNVELDENRFILGSFGGVSDIDSLIEDFRRTEMQSDDFRLELLPISELIKQ